MTMIRNRRLAAGLLALSLLVLPGAANAAAAPFGGARAASTVIRNATGGTVGWAFFTDAGRNGVQVIVLAFGLTAGLHGLHIHTVGSCVGPDFASAGPHFNPLGTAHGAHAGDLPNLSVGPAGIGHLITHSTSFTLAPGQLSIFDGDGAALVIHANPDDGVTNPSGNSGPRIACGVIAPLSLC
jgi:Cu-Zn family superoxide dismutase